MWGKIWNSMTEQGGLQNWLVTAVLSGGMGQNYCEACERLLRTYDPLQTIKRQCYQMQTWDPLGKWWK